MDTDRWNRRQWRDGRGAPRIAGGAIIAVVGLLLLLQNLGFVRVHDLWVYWPAILIVLGVARLADAHGSGGMVFGGALAGIGALLLLGNLDILRVDFNLIWPLILVAFGLSMLWRALETRTRVGDTTIPPVGDDLHLFAFFGGVKRRIEATGFKGGEISAVFGGVELDLRGSTMATGQAVLEISSMFGGVEMKVPDTWVVDSRMNSIFAGVEDRTVSNRCVAASEAPRLVITGYSMFAGLTIRN